MQHTTLETKTLPAIAANNAVAVARGMKDKPVRALVENVGPILVFLSDAGQALVAVAGITPKIYRLAVGASQVFVLAEEQTLFGAGAGAGAMVSVAVSELVPEEQLKRRP